MKDYPLCDNDFVLRKENGKIYSINMIFDNVLRSHNIPPIILSKFKNYGMPAGLALLNTINHAQPNEQMVCHKENNTTVCVNESLYDNLLKLYHKENDIVDVNADKRIGKGNTLNVKKKKNTHKRIGNKYNNHVIGSVK